MYDPEEAERIEQAEETSEKQPTMSGRSFTEQMMKRAEKSGVPPEILELMDKEEEETLAKMNRKPSGGQPKHVLKNRKNEKLKSKSRKKNRKKKKKSKKK